MSNNIKVHTLCLGFPDAHHDGRRRTVTLGDLICNYSSKEVISCKCTECSIKDEVKVETNISAYTEISSIRIDCICRDEDTHGMVQIKTAVNFDTKNFDLFEHTQLVESAAKYTLIGIIKHIMRLEDKAHYVCYTRKKNNEWYKYDDQGSSIVKVVKGSSNEAYSEFQQHVTVLFIRCKHSVQA